MIDTVLVLLAFVGHIFLWVAFINRVHSTAMPHKLTRLWTFFGFFSMGSIPIAFGIWFAMAGVAVVDRAGWFQIHAPLALYLGICWLFALMTAIWWGVRLTMSHPPDLLRYHRTRLFNLLAHNPEDLETDSSDDSPDPDEHHFLVRLPGNEILQLDIAERALEIADLPKSLDRMSIVHLSDLHFTGKVGKRYFEEVVRLANLFNPDVVALTGDLVDNNECIDWIPDTLGQLTSRFGVFFVLGNHDMRCDTHRLRTTLTDCGLTDLGGRWIEVHLHDEPVIFAGNELPWSPPAADLENAPAKDDDGQPIRILLSHSPDQLEWARNHQVDLMLAGHLHGGQIQIPLWGPIFSPSKKGVAYASGTFDVPPTVMHVSRGISGEIPVRMNCPPEMAKLVLHSAEGMAGRLL